ncbi:MAG: hypothetical protein ACOZIN_19100 [Myxococcota bacterium]
MSTKRVNSKRINNEFIRKPLEKRLTPQGELKLGPKVKKSDVGPGKRFSQTAFEEARAAANAFGTFSVADAELYRLSLHSKDYIVAAGKDLYGETPVTERFVVHSSKTGSVVARGRVEKDEEGPRIVWTRSHNGSRPRQPTETNDAE